MRKEGRWREHDPMTKLAGLGLQDIMGVFGVFLSFFGLFFVALYSALLLCYFLLQLLYICLISFSYGVFLFVACCGCYVLRHILISTLTS